MNAKWFKISSFCLVLLVAGITGLLAQVNVTAQLKSQEIWIGDQVRLTVQISLPSNVKFKEVKLKEALQAVPKVELVDRGSVLSIAQSPQQILEQQFVLTSFEAGNYNIPIIAIDYEEDGLIKSANTPVPLQLKVTSIPVNPKTRRSAH